MARKRNRQIEVFSLSFLDCICCGFGAVILIFVITTGRGLKQFETVVAGASSQINALELNIAQTQLTIEQLEAALDEAKTHQDAAANAQTQAAKIQKKMEEKQAVLGDLLGAISVREEALQAHADREPEVPVEQTQPQYLTEFSLDGQRVLILVEASGGMLGHSVDEALLFLKKTPDQRLQSPKWEQVRTAVKTLLYYLPEDASYQIVFFANDLTVLEGARKGSPWIPVKDAKARAQVFVSLDQHQPQGGANHEQAFGYARSSGADNIILLTDGLPTRSQTYASPDQVTQTHRLVMLEAALQALPQGIPVNILLFPMAGDPGAPAHLWQLANRSGGSMITPAPDWPQ